MPTLATPRRSTRSNPAPEAEEAAVAAASPSRRTRGRRKAAQDEVEDEVEVEVEEVVEVDDEQVQEVGEEEVQELEYADAEMMDEDPATVAARKLADRGVEEEEAEEEADEQDKDDDDEESNNNPAKKQKTSSIDVSPIKAPNSNKNNDSKPTLSTTTKSNKASATTKKTTTAATAAATAAAKTKLKAMAKNSNTIFGLSHSYPPISLTTIRTLKWGYCRDLMTPFLSAHDKANIHKKTRADLSEMLEKKVLAGLITPERFWDVVGLDKVNDKKRKSAGFGGEGSTSFGVGAAAAAPPTGGKAPLVSASMIAIAAARAAAAAASAAASAASVSSTKSPTTTIAAATASKKSPKNGTTTTTAAKKIPNAPPPGVGGPHYPPSHHYPPPPSSSQHPPYGLGPPVMPGIPPPRGGYLYPPPMMTGGGGGGPPPIMPPPSMGMAPAPALSPYPPRLTFKYTVHAPTFWPTHQIGYPIGVVIGEPNPPPPPTAPPMTTIQGIFYSSGVLPFKTLSTGSSSGSSGSMVQTEKEANQIPKIDGIEKDENGSKGGDDNVIKKQCQNLFQKIELLLQHINGRLGDVISVNIQVVDVAVNGREVLRLFGDYFGSEGREKSGSSGGGSKSTSKSSTKKSGVALSIVGVSGLLHEGAMVQMEFRAVVRRGPMTSFILERLT